MPMKFPGIVCPPRNGMKHASLTCCLGPHQLPEEEQRQAAERGHPGDPASPGLPLRPGHGAQVQGEGRGEEEGRRISSSELKREQDRTGQERRGQAAATAENSLLTPCADSLGRGGEGCPTQGGEEEREKGGARGETLSKIPFTKHTHFHPLSPLFTPNLHSFPSEWH